jgi:hypothetical protein
MPTNDAPKGEQLGPSDPLGASYTVGDLIRCLRRLNPELPIYSVRNNKLGIGLHHHAFVDSSKDYVSYTHLEYLNDEEI